MLNGICLPNQPMSLEDITRLRILQPQAAKLFWYHNQSDVVRMRALGINHFVCRLPDSVADGDRWKGVGEWAQECILTIKKFVPLGVLSYQMDNEPNLTWKPLDEQKTVETWRWLTEQVVREIRKSPDVPVNVRLGLAPLSWKPDTYTAVQNVWIPEQRLIADLFDWYAVHSYWQYGKWYNHPPYGGNVTHWHDVLLGDSKPYVITEWGSSVHELPGVTPKEVEQLRLAQYPAWLEWVRTKPYVEATFLFHLNGTSDWRGFEPGDKVLKAI